MNFTREPIIETIITPKDGCKLLVRNSKGGSQEEYAVDAVEVVSFGHSFFFRSTERPKSFLVPVSDYEVIEVKETRVVLKNVNFERAIKIGGGREATIKATKETEKVAEAEGQEPSPSPTEPRLDNKKRDRHRRRRRSRGGEEAMKESSPETEKTKPLDTESSIRAGSKEGGGKEDEAKVSSPTLSRLIPPPAELISYKFAKEKREAAAQPPQEALPPELSGEFVLESDPSDEDKNRKHLRRKKKDDEDPQDFSSGTQSAGELPSDDSEMHRSSQKEEMSSFTTSFSSLSEEGDSTPFGKIW